MRKALGLLFVTSLLIPVGVLAAAPAGAVAGTTCKGFVATQTSTPGLPILTSKAKINVTTVTTGNITGCVGGGVKSATISGKYKYNGNCTTLFTGKGGKTTPAAPLLTFKWNTGVTSTATAKLTVLTVKAPIKIKIDVKITKGLFAGGTNSITTVLTSPKGSCVTIPGAKGTTTGGKFTIK
jgi:hypothetical protein